MPADVSIGADNAGAPRESSAEGVGPTVKCTYTTLLIFIAVSWNNKVQRIHVLIGIGA